MAHRMLQALPLVRAAVAGARGMSTASGAGAVRAERPGELWCWGHSDDGHVRTPEAFPEVGGCVAASCGLYHVGAVTGDGRLFTWGRGEGGRLGNRIEEFNRNRGGSIPLHAPEPALVDVEEPLREYGVVDSEMPYVVAVAGGGLHTLVLMSDGRVMGFGFGRFGQLGLGFRGTAAQFTPLQLLALEPARHVAAGGTHSAAVCVDGGVYTWGRGDNGRLGYRDANLTQHTPRRVNILDGFEIGSVACGGFHTAALASDGKGLWMWGAGENGELGTGYSKIEQEPRLVQELAGQELAQVSLGGFHSAAVTAGGEVLTWGGGSLGQLGHGNCEKQALPTVVKGLPPAKQVSCGGGHTAVVTQSGELWMFGSNAEGQCGHDGVATVRAPVLVDAFEGRRVLHVACGGSKTAAIVEPAPE